MQKGRLSEKNQILNVLLKVTFYLGRGLDQNQASVKFWGNSESGNSGERLVWGLASLSDFFSVPYLKKVKFWGNSGETQKIIFKAHKSAGKLGGNSGETQRIIINA